MTEQYKNRLIELATELKGIRDKHEKIQVTDSQLYEKIDHIVGYIQALEEV